MEPLLGTIRQTGRTTVYEESKGSDIDMVGNLVFGSLAPSRGESRILLQIP